MNMPLYKLTLTTIFQRKVWLIALLCVLLFPIVLPHLTPVDVNPTLLEPARAQAAWVTLWIVSIAWVLFQAAGFGDNTAKSGLGAYFLSQGVSRVSQMIQVWLACVTFLLPLVVITVAICLIGAMPSGDGQAKMWIATNLQYASLFILVISPLMMLAASIGSRFGATIGYIVPVSLALYGMYGVGYLAMMTEVDNNPLLDTLYVISPHYYLADLTPRLVFKQGSMVGKEFLQLVIYFVAIKLVFTMFSTVCFKVKSPV